MNLDERNEQNETTGAAPVAFCQNCGRPLNQTTVRNVGRAVYCEPCLEARLSGEAAFAGAAPGAGPAAGAIPGAMPNSSSGAAWQWGSGMPGNWAPKSGPNPGLAALLGAIPGVGAMYNEQYAKGIFHLLVFAVLVSLSHSSDLFGFFTFGWICYMVIEAHHTARARRDGTPLPNPFGLNELGERLGFGRAWPGTAPAGNNPAAASGGSTAAGYPPQNVPGAVATDGGVYASPATPWGAPSDAFTAARGAAYDAGYAPGFPPSYVGGYVPPVPPFPAYGMPYNQGFPSTAQGPYIPPAYVPPAYVAPASRFPAGAVWLIGLGIIFLLSTTGIFHMVFGWSLVGFVLIGLAVWIFLRRMLDTGVGVANDHSAGYPLRVVRALGPSVWLFVIGVLLLLDAFHIVPWHRSWPLFIILAGVMALLQRAAYNSAAAAAFATSQYPVASASGESVGRPPNGEIPTGEGQGSAERANDSNPHQGGN